MKHLVLIAACLFGASLGAQLIPYVGNQSEQTAKHEIFRKNRIRSMDEYWMEDETAPLRTGVWTGRRSFDKQGRLTDWTYTPDKGPGVPRTDTVTMRFQYLENGLLERYTLQDNRSAQPTVVQFQYDDQFRPVKEFVSAADPREYEYEYDGRGILLEKKGSTVFPLVDEKGRQLDSTIWAPIDRYVFRFDAKGRLAKYDYEQTDVVLNYYLYEYAAEGRMIIGQLYYPGLNIPLVLETRFFYENGLDEKRIVQDLRFGEGHQSLYKYDVTQY